MGRFKDFFIRPEETDDEESRDDRIFQDITGTHEKVILDIVEDEDNAEEETKKTKVTKKSKSKEKKAKDSEFETLEEKEKRLEEEAEAEIMDEVEETLAEEVKAESEETSENQEDAEPEESKVEDTKDEVKIEEESKVDEATERFKKRLESGFYDKPGEHMKIPEFLMRPKPFYDEIGEKKFESDRMRVLTEEVRVDILHTLKAYPELVEEVMHMYHEAFLDCNPELIDGIISENFEEYLGRNYSDDTLAKIELAISKVADNNIKIGVEFVNQHSGEVFSDWDKALASIQDYISYGADPEKVFEKRYFWLDKPDEKIDSKIVKKYINSFKGNKKALSKKLHFSQKD